MILPFIMVTGRDDANLAVQMMKFGACDYLLKDTTFLDRLPAVVARTHQEAETRERLRRTELSLRQSESRLMRAQKIAGMGSWEWNIQTGEIYWSDELFRIFGLNPADHPRIELDWVFSLVNPVDLPAFKKVIFAAAKNGQAFNVVYRIISSTEGEVVVNSQGEVE